jgi:hypothetical protein
MFKLFAFFLLTATLVVGFGGILLVAFGSQDWSRRGVIPVVPTVPPPPPPAPYTGGAESLPLTDDRWEEPRPPEG